MTSDATALGGRLGKLLGRLELYLAHVAGPALRRRVALDDLVQDTVVRTLGAEAAGALEGEALWAYVRGTARHVVVDAARRARHAPRRMSSIAPERGDSTAGAHAAFGAGPGMGPVTAAGDLESRTRLLAAYQALSPEHRRVIGLRRFEGLSARDAAQRMGRSESAVHSLFRRALEDWAGSADLG